MREFSLTVEQACGIVGNIGFESGGFKTLQEISPLIPGSAGGYGWAQWTGPRRTDFMAWCVRQKLEPSSDQANYGYLVEELRGDYNATIRAVRNQADLSSAVFSVGETYERPGGTTTTNLPGFSQRLVMAQRALNGAKAMTGQPYAMPAPDPAPPTGDSPVQAAVKALQLALNALGATLDVDGDMGPRTSAAYNRYR
jgi:hypothetical protein